MNKSQIEIISHSSFQTKRLGEFLGREILKKKRKSSLVIGLRGDLGGGKTTFLKGLARGLGIKEKILSPTFIIFRHYEIKNKNFKKFYHFDCYRIENEKDLLNLGLKEIFSKPENIIALEWSEKIETQLPRGCLIIELKFVNQKTRKINIKR